MTMNQRRLSQYELQTELESDRLSELWKAFDTQQRYYVTIKILHIPQAALGDFAPKFLQETQKLAALQHPNIARVIDTQIVTNAQGTHACVVTDYLEGELLADFLHATVHAGTFLEAKDLVKLLSEIGSAIDYAHQHGIIHGAIQPTNILLSKRDSSVGLPGEAKLLGFGMQHFIPAQALPMEDTQYISPERAQGLNENLRSDIYALGMLLYELSTGTLPFQGETTAEMLAQQAQAIPTSPALINPHIRPALTAVIMRSLAKEPANRFSSAMALVGAAARALQVAKDFPSLVNMTPSLTPTGYSVALPTQLDSMNSPTYLTPASPQQESGAYRVLPMSSNYSPAQAAPGRNTDGMTAIQAQQREPIADPVRQTPQAQLPLAVEKESWRPGKGYVALISLLIAALLVSAVSIFLLNQTKTVPNNRPAANTLVRQVFFASSGQLNPNTIQGSSDRLQISLQQMPAPAAGKSFYIWLLAGAGNVNDSQPLLLGSSAKGGQITGTFAGDSQHNNLLASYNRILITEESTDSPPTNPSLDPQTHRFGAEFSNVSNPEDSSGYSLLAHMRHLLSQDPKLKTAGLTGGLDIWLFRNTMKILETAGSIRDSQDTNFIRRQLVRILDYLDSSSYIQSENLPAGMQAVDIDPTIAKVAILNFDNQQNPPGYLKHIGNHLRSISTSPSVSADQKALAIQINNAINNVQAWMGKVHTDANTLIHLPADQLTQPAGVQLLDDLFTQANTALVGQTDPNTNQVKEGVIQIHYNIQRLATFTLVSCQGASSPGCE